MNFDKLFAWVVGVVIAFASVGKLDVLQGWIWKAQAKVIYDSRTSTWGSPKFFSASARTPTTELCKLKFKSFCATTKAF